ncbi:MULTISPECIES: cryptochrome/photolyase family protein [unclassified Sphingobium]|uniref:cryptochrome/photolyase family protein n=1 Tax=unclassified Sphingobium TaxID=2611147 RepID=UPI0022253D66|nr:MULTISPECIES: deoxyribodipyrimidine photo-lyase [unclassified Sphingobium]MCW2381882.1 deoxyribodipyrimidine photo-lyase [Sphingobium sp. B2D3B]MCW2398012.1 deoxyribodipyrimidine photo-lyase [Sphingobium sp. B2D3C]
MSAPSILWFRRDLRLTDQAALTQACADGPAIPVYILDDETARHRAMGGASRWWLHHSIESLDAALRARGSRLILRRGKTEAVLAALAAETGATRIHALHHYEPWWRQAEKAVARSHELILHDGNYLMPPGAVTTGSGGPYKIFTPFWRALREVMPPAQPVPAPDTVPAPQKWPVSDQLENWALLPTSPNWAGGFAHDWSPGEAGAHDRLDAFIDHVGDYDEGRNLPSIEGSSRLSPHLHFGEISPATLWHALDREDGASEVYLRELGWRDYAQNVIAQISDYGSRNGRAQLDAFPWRSGHEAVDDLKAWQEGRTGYPIVDAGMRQLWQTGWMHNRVRMIAASFLIKHLLLDWREGERWFWDTLVDADYGNNAVNWQWVAGTGIDSNMFVRIMAPLTQSEKFDAAAYIRRWVPELAHVKDGAVHDPDAAGARPVQYPAKLIEHRAARERALAAYARVKG